MTAMRLPVGPGRSFSYFTPIVISLPMKCPRLGSNAYAFSGRVAGGGISVDSRKISTGSLSNPSEATGRELIATAPLAELAGGMPFVRLGVLFLVFVFIDYLSSVHTRDVICLLVRLKAEVN